MTAVASGLAKILHQQSQRFFFERSRGTRPSLEYSLEKNSPVKEKPEMQVAVVIAV